MFTLCLALTSYLESLQFCDTFRRAEAWMPRILGGRLGFGNLVHCVGRFCFRNFLKWSMDDQNSSWQNVFWKHSSFVVDFALGIFFTGPNVYK